MDRKISKKNAEKKSHSRLYGFLVLIISLLCAVLLWLYVLGYDSPDFEKKFSQIPVTIIGNTELAEKTGYRRLVRRKVRKKRVKSCVARLKTIAGDMLFHKSLRLAARVSAAAKGRDAECSLSTRRPAYCK